LGFETSEKVSIQKEIVGGDNIHKFFINLVEGMGAEVDQISPKTFTIKKKVTASNVDTPIVIKTDQISLERLYLKGKISKNGVQDLITKIPNLVSLNIISDNSMVDAVLISGEVKFINQLRYMIDKLDVVKSLPAALSKDEIVASTSISTPKIEEEITKLKVIDLDFADANELVQTLMTLLSSDTITKNIKVSAHQSANQVILSGSPQSIEQAVAVIASMDRAPRQVYVDAIIAEISEESAQKLGLQFAINDNNFSASVVTGQSGGNIGALAGNAFLTAAAGGLVAIGAGANKVPDIGIMIDALKGDTDNRILATPSLMTIENKESTILIGQNVPFITGKFTNQQGDGAAPFQTIKREDLGTILKIKPKIGKKGDIMMEIWQEISRIDQSAAVLSDVVTVKRQISTVVSARDGETIAIGGLQVEQEEIGVSKVPILGDIPVLGMLFRQESSKTVSRNLAIFLRPTLVSTEKQRNKVVEIWRTNLEDKLFDYEDNEMMSRSPTPVGQRLKIPTLRPKLRTSGGN
jgi:general secretion pathway protein D|tara:strand:- start:8445 stop:10013 length:1569 start_codon:yes stop_codon:yes gene_type:complete